MIAITDPDYSLEQVFGDSARNSRRSGLDLRDEPSLKITPEQADVAGVKEPSWLEQP